MDETGDNTHGKKVGRRGGVRVVVGTGQGARILSEPTIATVIPTSNFDGHLVMLIVIFLGKKLNDSWCIGIDVFADFDDDEMFYENNFGPGKRYPCIQLLNKIGNTNACMTGEILTEMFKMMDKLLGISERGTNENGNPMPMHDHRWTPFPNEPRYSHISQ